MIDGTLLKDMLNKSVFQPIVQENNVWVAKLKETAALAGLREVDICGVSKDSILLKMDIGAPPADLLKHELGQRCRCDYVLLTEYKGLRLIVYIDLKTAAGGHLHKGELVQQFKGACCMTKYLEAILELFHAKKDYFGAFPERRYVVFYKPRLQKNPTRPLPFKNNKPESFLRYPNPIRPKIGELVGV